MCPSGGRGERTQARQRSSCAKASCPKKGLFEATAAGPAWPPQPRRAGARALPRGTRGHFTSGPASPASHAHRGHTHRSLQMSLHCWAYTEIPFALNQPQAPGPDQPRDAASPLPPPRNSPYPACRQDGVSPAPRFLCASCLCPSGLHEAAVVAVAVSCVSDLEKRLCRLGRNQGG